MAVSQELLEVIGDVFSCTCRPDKITASFDPISRSLIVVYEDLDDEYYKELIQLANA
jgi:hypothetical protein